MFCFIGWKRNRRKLTAVKSLKAGVPSVSPSSERMAKGWCLKRQLWNSLRWPIYVINSVDNTELPCYTLLPTQHHRFFRTNPLYSFSMWDWITSYEWASALLISKVIFCSVSYSASVVQYTLIHHSHQRWWTSISVNGARYAHARLWVDKVSSTEVIW